MKLQAVRDEVEKDVNDGFTFAQAGTNPDTGLGAARCLHRWRCRMSARELSFAEAIREALGPGHGSR